jgi:hypothetical protein
VTLCRRIRVATISCALSICIVFASSLAGARADEKRWRMFGQETELLLAIADTDEPGHVLPQFSCTRAVGFIEVYGEAREDLRIAMAEFVRTGQRPVIQVQPDLYHIDPIVDLIFSHEGWRYKYSLIGSDEAFERFRREGVLEFKLGKVLVHEEFKVGLDDVGKFVDLCKGGMR